MRKSRGGESSSKQLPTSSASYWQVLAQRLQQGWRASSKNKLIKVIMAIVALHKAFRKFKGK